MWQAHFTKDCDEALARFLGDESFTVDAADMSDAAMTSPMFFSGRDVGGRGSQRSRAPEARPLHPELRNSGRFDVQASQEIGHDCPGSIFCHKTWLRFLYFFVVLVFKTVSM